jgi:hypothetical protein
VADPAIRLKPKVIPLTFNDFTLSPMAATPGRMLSG